MHRNRTRLGWLLAALGAIFLLGGLTVMIFATLPVSGHAPQPSLSPWVSLANAIMNFVLALLQVQWTPPRTGVFLIFIGLLLEGGAAYLMLTPGHRRH